MSKLGNLFNKPVDFVLGPNPLKLGKSLIGGGGDGSSSAPPPAPLPPPPKRADPEIKEAKEKQRRNELSRKGRRAAILFGDEPEAELGATSISRPEARGGSQLLGQ